MSCLPYLFSSSRVWFSAALLGLMALSRGVGADAAPHPVWNDNFATVQAAARLSGKPMLLNFTGTDWCVWCHRLRDQVFNTTTFVSYAGESLILVEVDFPRTKTLSPELTEQNRQLAKKYEISSYPTVVLIDADGKELGRTGYMQGGAKTFIRELKRFQSRAKAKDA